MICPLGDSSPFIYRGLKLFILVRKLITKLDQTVNASTNTPLIKDYPSRDKACVFKKVIFSINSYLVSILVLEEQEKIYIYRDTHEQKKFLHRERGKIKKTQKERESKTML